MMLGKIENIRLKEISYKCCPDFTSWLSNNLKDVGSAVQLELKFVAKDILPCPFSVNILAKDEKTNKFIVVVSQLEDTDYEDLGKFISYASVLNASSIIWIASGFSDEQKKALDWLNNNTSDETNFYGIKIEIWKIDNSHPAVRFNTIIQPNTTFRQCESGYIDKTEKKLTGKEQVANELQNSLNKANAIVRLNPEGKILFANKLFCDMLEYEPDELMQMNYNVLIPDIEAQKNFKQCQCWEKSKKGIYHQEKFITKTKNGKEKWIESIFLPILNKEEKLIFILKIANDVTDKIKHQIDLEQRKLKAEKALVVKDNFLCNMSHEIRNSLNIIIGFIDLLRKEKLNDTQFDYVDTISSAGECLLHIVNDMLELSKIDSGNFSIEKKPFNPATVLKSVYKMQSEKAHKKNITLKKEIHDTIPELVLGDEYRLNQIITNLVDNAIKFTSEGFVKISASVESVDDNNCVLLIRVQDTGIGICEEKQKTIFQRYSQADSDITRKFGGTGLGLNIVKSLVDSFNGSLKLESKIGEGSVFSVSIPFGLEDRSKEDKQGANTGSKHTQKILMFEDNSLSEKLAKKIIYELGHELIIVSDGYEGLEWLKSNYDVDLILMDLEIPGMDGFETTSIIRKELKLNAPIIAMTAHSLNQEKSKCIQYGMNDFLSKPFKLEVLSNKVQTALNGKKRSVTFTCGSVEQKPDKQPDFEELKLLSSRKDLLKKCQASSFIKSRKINKI